MAKNNNPQLYRQVSQNRGSSPTTVGGSYSLYSYPSDLGSESQQPYIIFDVVESVQNRNKILDTLALYMPPTLKVSYGATYENIDLSLLGSGVAGLENMGSAFGSWGDALKSATSAGQMAGSVIAGTFSSSASAGLELSQRKVMNPHSAVLFKNMQFRQFSFDFQMMAKNKAETESIKIITEKFKYYMHPDTQGGSGGLTSLGTLSAQWFKYPENFNISFYAGADADKFLFKLKTCVLTDLSVDYASSGGAPVFFENGAPVDIRMSLTFKELNPLTKADIKAGH